MTTVVHGGLQAAELAALGLAPADVVDLSASLHPAGPHPAVLAAARAADLARYPEPDAGSLRDALAARARLSPEQVLVTAGATAAIHLAARALLAPGDDCAIFPPTFGEYAAAVAAAGGHAVEYRARPPAFAHATDPRPAPLAYLCNPNNPTGHALDRPAVERTLHALGGTLCLDVAYAPFVANGWDANDLVRDGAPVLVLHSLTKLHAMPGLRVGYVTGSERLIARLARLQPAWSVGAPALAAGLAASAVEAERLAATAAVHPARERIHAALVAAGVAVTEARANFVMAHVGDAPTFRVGLLHRGFAVRDCTSFGLPEWVRIAVPPAEQLERLIDALGKAAADRPSPRDAPNPPAASRVGGLSPAAGPDPS